MKCFKEYDVKGKNVFISGPMTGIPHYNVEKFAAVHAELKEAGAKRIYDPAIEWLLNEYEDKGHECYMRKSTRLLADTRVGNKPVYDVVVVLDGWGNSKGARAEIEVAKACGVDVIYTVPTKEVEEAESLDEFANNLSDGDLATAFAEAIKIVYNGGNHDYEA